MLSKTQFLYFLQCPKYLWLYKNKKELLKGEENLDYKQLQGESVEFWVYRELENSIDCKTKSSIFDDMKNTQEVIKSGSKVLIQPSFFDGDIFCRNDLLIFNEVSDCWDLIEIKSTTEVKDLHIIDVAFQKQCLINCGLKIGNIYIYYVNNQYIKNGNINPSELIKKEDITERVNSIEIFINDKIEKALDFIKKTQEEPKIKILKQCFDPYECGFTNYCWKDIPEHSVYDLSLKEDHLIELVNQGKINIEDVPEGYVTRENKQNYYIAKIQDKILINEKNIKEELSKLAYPLYFLDYESYSPAVPLFDGFHPYQQMVFQYSLHIIRNPKAKAEHYEFLGTEWENPLPALLKSLTSNIGEVGTVLVWNESFEKTRNKEMAGMYPKFKDQLLSINNRVYDLGIPFKNGYYIHKDFKGSWSIKAILPVMIPWLSYKELNIQKGGDASASYRKLIELKTSEEKDNLKKDMLQYCGLDTLAMVEIFKKLEEV